VADTALAPASAAASTGDDLAHVYCCNPDVALCGTDVTGVPEVPDEDTTCVVCLDLEDADFACCPTCPDGGHA
jgi:hypothetical protein